MHDSQELVPALSNTSIADSCKRHDSVVRCVYQSVSRLAAPCKKRLNGSRSSSAKCSCPQIQLHAVLLSPSWQGREGECGKISSIMQQRIVIVFGLETRGDPITWYIRRRPDDPTAGNAHSMWPSPTYFSA